MEKKYKKEALRSLFSLSFFKALGSSFGYYLHEHVTWRYKMKHGPSLLVQDVYKRQVCGDVPSDAAKVTASKRRQSYCDAALLSL